MSRTDATRPMSVKCLDDPTWLVEDHDHRAGSCDLPPRPTRTPTSPFGSHDGRTCTWAASAAFWADRTNGCGCSTCATQVDRRIKTRRQRHDGALEVRDEQRTAWTRASTSGTAIDDLSDVPDLFADTGPSDFHDEVALNADVRRALDLPDTSLVVDIDHAWGYLDDPALRDLGDEPAIVGTAVSVLHNDGARETLRFAQPLADFLRARTGLVGA